MTQHTKLHQLREEQSGFTIVELTLSTAFIAFILIFMLATMTQVMSNYNKGLAVKQINQTARTVSDEMSRLIGATNSDAIITSYLADGRVCLGGVSYVWNVDGATTNKYDDAGHTSFTMVRVTDPGGSLCTSGTSFIPKAGASELLSSQIWVQQIGVAVSSNNALVDITISLSTASPNQPTGTDPILGTICDGSKDSQYCAIATFKTTVATKNGG
jgi:Flp pilus assembly pilin Flp